MQRIRRALRFLRDREWVAVTAAATAGIVWVETELDWLSTMLDAIPELESEASIAKVLIVIMGAMAGRHGVTSERTAKTDAASQYRDGFDAGVRRANRAGKGDV